MKRKGITCGLATLLIFLAGAFFPALADVVINEVMASNGWFENGHAWDWVELYNDGKKAVSLEGWYFSDSKKDPMKWSFPKGAKIKGGGYLTIFCTGEEAAECHACLEGRISRLGYRAVSARGDHADWVRK